MFRVRAWSLGLFIGGVLLTATSWGAAWSRIGLFTEYSFFPLWIGFIITVNGISEILYTTSLMRKMGFAFLLLFIASIPLWWFFEGVNRIVRNWEYILPYPVSGLHYFLQASMDFSTVVPAVLSAVFLTCRVMERQSRWWSIRHRKWVMHRGFIGGFIAIGIASFVGLWLFPNKAFPLVWIAPMLILEPIAYISDLPSLLREVAEGRLLLTVSVMVSTLFIGILWELWNFYSLPKWVYHIPYAGFYRIFEMPVLGYLGYLFFGLIVFSWTSIFLALFRLDIDLMIERR
jgi:hypothetical protein